MEKIILYVVVGIFYVLSMTGYAYMIFSNIRDDLRREKERKEAMKMLEARNESEI